MKAILATWWPLAASWLLMGIEIPMITSVINRLPEEKVHAAAFGGVIFPIAILIESPIIMMLAASTRLCTDVATFKRLRRYMTQIAFGLTVVHGVIAFSPLFDLIAVRIIDAPPSTIEPARVGFALMLFWTWAIADRRFHQGVLIRFGRTRLVGVGTIIRLLGTSIPLAIGVIAQARYDTIIPGATIAAAAMASGVVFEAAYARWCARAVVRGPLQDGTASQVLSLGAFLKFYVPLALSPLLALLSMPIGAAGICRMPNELAALAVWPALNGFSFMVRSVAVAYNEVVVRHAEDPGGPATLLRFAWILGIVLSVITIIVAATPLGTQWFRDVMGLEPELVELARHGLWFTLVMPVLSVMHAYYQGMLVHLHRTQGITEAVVVFIVCVSIGVLVGIRFAEIPGSSFMFIALTFGGTGQALWLALRYWMIVRERRDPDVDPEAGVVADHELPAGCSAS